MPASARPPGQDTPPPRRRVRDPQARRAAILAAAAAVFAEHGYPGTTVRAIADRAGVTHGLVLRHFGSKEQLFLAAVPGPRDLGHALAAGGPGEPTELAERIAAAYVDRMEAADGADPFVALIRSAATDLTAATSLLAALQDESLDSYRTVLDVPDLDTRVAIVGAHLIGVTFSRYVLRHGPLATLPAAEVQRRLAETLRAILQHPA